MKFVWTALAAGLLTILWIGVGRTALEYTRSGDRVLQRSCGDSALDKYCVERHVVPGIPLLRDEQRTVQVHSADDPARYWSTSDPFTSDVTITWTQTGVALVGSSGVTLVLDRKVMDALAQ